VTRKEPECRKLRVDTPKAGVKCRATLWGPGRAWADEKGHDFSPAFQRWVCGPQPPPLVCGSPS